MTNIPKGSVEDSAYQYAIGFVCKGRLPQTPYEIGAVNSVFDHYMAGYNASPASSGVQAHSKSEYKRLSALGVDVTPPIHGWITGPDEYGSVYVHFQAPKAGAVKKTLPESITVNVDYDENGKLYGVELLGVPSLAGDG